MKLLIDENLSPKLVEWAAAEGIYAQSVIHAGLAGAEDSQVWQYAFQHDQVVVTTNVADFMNLAAGIELHPGVIALRESGLSRGEQWIRLNTALAYIEEYLGGELINQVLEVVNPLSVRVLHIPPA